MKRSAATRILMLLENLPFPQDLRVRREAYALYDAGYRVTVICPAAPGQPSRETVNGVRVYRYPAPPAANGFLGYIWEYGYSMLTSFLLSVVVFFSGGFDVVHAHNPPDTFVFIALFYKLFGKRFIYDHHDLSPEMYQARFARGGIPAVYRVLVWLEKLSCRFADHVVVTNESYKRIAIERGGVPESRITIVRNGIELSRLEGAIEPDRGLRQMEKTIIGYVGVMGFQDGVDYLLRALRHLIHNLRRTDFHCILIGDGDAWTDLKAQAHRLGLDGYVHFTGFLHGEELRRYLSAADICVDSAPSNPYSDRSTMFKIMEYMSLAKPIVAFDLPEHRFTAQQAAVYASPNDERAFAQALVEVMDDPRRRASLGMSGILRIRTQLAWDYSIPNLIGVYRAVLPRIRQTSARDSQHAKLGVKPQSSSYAHAPEYKSGD
jgi:glycosyltransferase involved in cell wall biosynthesis